jgi:hypothetical protein
MVRGMSPDLKIHDFVAPGFECRSSAAWSPLTTGWRGIGRLGSALRGSGRRDRIEAALNF